MKSISDYLTTEGIRYIDENVGSSGAETQPFHARLMPGPFLAWKRLSERSFSTRSGSWFQQIAVRVGRQYHLEAQSPYLVTGSLKPAAKSQIEELLVQMDQTPNRRRPSREADVRDVLAAQFPGGEASQQRVDLYVRRRDGHELFFEMKTPGPNKDTSRTMKRAILYIMAMKKGEPADAFASMAYNPFSPSGDGEPYTWNYALQFLELGTDLLVGRPFWEAIGEKSTYDELLAIAANVGKELEEHLERAVQAT